jgi:benzodiazapine receptor
MNKDLLRQIINVLTVILTLTVNGLANALPINGLNTGQISDMFQVYFVPAGYVFSIWGLIYLALIAFAVYQALPSQ